jgi:hypothetical protein
MLDQHKNQVHHVEPMFVYYPDLHRQVLYNQEEQEDALKNQTFRHEFHGMQTLWDLVCTAKDD